MKAHTTIFKDNISNVGRQFDVELIHKKNGNNYWFAQTVHSLSYHYEADILKSVMKQLDLTTTRVMDIGDEINCKIGILNTTNGRYEYLNYGNFIIYDIERQEDTKLYEVKCYDKMLYSMKQNEDLNITYPISIKNYLNAIANKLGLSVATTTFYNENMMIQEELYLGLDYTYRDILDEIAQATGSIICLNENDEIVLKYPTQTNDTIDGSFLKDINVDFGQMYGAINTIVLSRSGESDNVYYPETLPENPIEIKIKDNQIMNWNDRSDYLPGIYNALNGLYYYINDFNSTGILYYEIGDLYNIQIENNTYQCLMLNDEINITTGIEEIIYTDMPEQSQTDYKKADKTDRRINQTYLIVDKQNQSIEALITTQTDQNQKIARVTQTVDELNSKISDIADITTSLETNSARLVFEDINQSEPIRVVIHPIGVNIAKLHPSPSLKPSSNLKIKTRILRFINTTTSEVFNYEIPDDLLYYDSENYDEFILDYESLTCVINKKCKWNADGTVGLLTNERTDEYTFPHIELTDGDYTVQLIQYNNGYLFVRLMAQNIYTTQFATKAELNSEISQTTQGINLSVDQKLSGYSTTNEMNSAINLKANEITSNVSNTYATKTELSSAETSLNSKIDQTAEGISLTVDRVEEKAETAQSTADTATTKADNAQSSANSAQNTANSINNNLTTNYYTKTQTNSAINQKADSITSTVSQTYSTKTETTSAKNAAIDSANANTAEVLKSYSTTKQMNSAIEQKANSITSTVSETYSTKTETNTAKNQAISSANTSTDNKLQSYSTTVQMNSAITQKANEISSVVSTKVGNNEVISKINQSSEAVTINANKISLAGKTINLTSDNIAINSTNFSVDKSGNMTCNNATLQGVLNFYNNSNLIASIKKGTYKTSSGATGTASIVEIADTTVPSFVIRRKNNFDVAEFYKISTSELRGISSSDGYAGYVVVNDALKSSNIITDYIRTSSHREDSVVTVYDGLKVEKNVYANAFINISKEENKKNFEKLDNALDILKNIDIYKYNFKNENNGTKKHIGFIIGNNYNYSEEVTSKDNDGADTYSFVSLCCKAIQEQQAQIEELQKEIKELKGGKE